MKLRNCLNLTNLTLLGSLCGSLLVGLTATPLTGIANALPRNESNLKTANEAAIARQLGPAPLIPIDQIAIEEGTIDIKLKNETNAPVSYQVIGDTKQRTLSGKSDTHLQTLDAPLNLTFHREDDGLLFVSFAETSTPGVIEVTLSETDFMVFDSRTLRVDRAGMVYLY